MKKSKFPKTKQELKELAQQIRFLKGTRGPSNNGYIHGLSNTQTEYRYAHIAYCMLYGTPYEKIENPKEENKISESLLEIHMKIIKDREAQDETVRNSLQ